MTGVQTCALPIFDADGSLTLYYSVEYISSKELGNLCLPEVKLAGNYEKETSEIYFTSRN